MEGPAAFQRGHRDDGGREEKRIDAIEIVRRVLEHARERLAVVFGNARRQIRRQSLGFAVVAIDEQLHGSAEQNGIVGAPHGGQKIRGRRR